MIPKVNLSARQLSSVPQTHRTATLRAIADKTHAMTEEIKILAAQGTRMGEILAQIPEDAGSRLDWLNRQLQQF